MLAQASRVEDVRTEAAMGPMVEASELGVRAEEARAEVAVEAEARVRV